MHAVHTQSILLGLLGKSTPVELATILKDYFTFMLHSNWLKNVRSLSKFLKCRMAMFLHSTATFEVHCFSLVEIAKLTLSVSIRSCR